MTTNAAPVPIGRIMLKNVRLSFAQNLTTAGTIPGSGADAKPKFNCGLLLGPDHPQLAEIEKKMQAVAKEQWKDKAPAEYKALQKADRLALHDGDLKPNYDGYPGNFFLSPSANENARPTYLGGADGTTPLDAKDAAKLFYGGCYVNASIELWAQDNQWGKRVNATLRGIQFLRHGDAFAASRPADSSEFEAIEGGADADEFA